MNSDKIMSCSQSRFSGLGDTLFVEVQDFGAYESGYIFKSDNGNGFNENIQMTGLQYLNTYKFKILASKAKSLKCCTNEGCQSKDEFPLKNIFE